MANQNVNLNNNSGEEWMKQRFPIAKAVDVFYTMDKYNFPSNAREYIFNNWIKVSNSAGGTYCEIDYFNQLPSNHQYKITYEKLNEKSKK